jgi:hypothetical protein
MPAAIAERMVRFHLTDNTRGEPPMWTKVDIKESRLILTVDEVGTAGVGLRLDGSVLLSSKDPNAKMARGYEAKLLGHIHYDTQKKQIDRFDVVVLGDHWGQGPYTGGARPGRSPLGVAFELARGDSCGHARSYRAERRLAAPRPPDR